MPRPTENEALRRISRAEKNARIAALAEKVKHARAYLENNPNLSPYAVRDILTPLEMEYKTLCATP